MFYDKLKEIADSRNESLAKIVKRIGISEAAASNYKKQKRSPNMDILIKISINYNISIDWLLEEEKELYKQSLTTNTVE